uniref:Uncharacterized protein n=1 Tax=Kalanchoe fedtschenkoi TaxID=63787 RepID=A0A7N0RHY2_KALFE
MASSSLCYLPSSPPLQKLLSRNQSRLSISRVNLQPERRPRFLGIRSSEVPDATTTTTTTDVKEEGEKKETTPFGYTRKDVLLIGVGATVAGLGLESGLEYAGVDPLQAGNAVQLVMVLGLTVGWIWSYVFRVSNKEMTYAQQLRDYEYKVMEKRLEGLTEAELSALMEQVEEEKRQLASSKKLP